MRSNRDRRIFARIPSAKPGSIFAEMSAWLASDIIELKARSQHGGLLHGGARSVVVCSADGIIPELDSASPGCRRRSPGAAAGSFQHDAGRIAEPVAETDAVAGIAAIRRDCHHHAHGLGDGALKHDPGGKPWSSLIAFIREPAMTAPRRSA